MKQLIVSKVLSGRFILTVIIGATFAYISIRGRIPSEAVIGVIVMVMRDYFSRPDRSKEESNGSPKPV